MKNVAESEWRANCGDEKRNEIKKWKRKTTRINERNSKIESVQTKERVNEFDTEKRHWIFKSGIEKVLKKKVKGKQT